MNKNIIIILLLSSLNLSSQTDTSKTYYENSDLKSVSYNSNKKIHLTWYYENASLKYKMVLNSDSIPISILKLNEFGDTLYVQNKKKCIMYDRKHNAIMYYKIKNGRYDGRATTYQDGILVYEMNYKKGLADGSALGYDPETKQIIAKEFYSNGKLNGEGLYFKKGKILQRKIFYENGCPVKVQTFSVTGEVVYETDDKEIINERFRSTENCK